MLRGFRSDNSFFEWRSTSALASRQTSGFRRRVEETSNGRCTQHSRSLTLVVSPPMGLSAATLSYPLTSALWNVHGIGQRYGLTFRHCVPACEFPGPFPARPAADFDRGFRAAGFSQTLPAWSLPGPAPYENLCAKIAS